jgi:hypothetical protein
MGAERVSDMHAGMEKTPENLSSAISVEQVLICMIFLFPLHEVYFLTQITS